MKKGGIVMENEIQKLIESEELEKVTGGYVFHVAPGCAGVETKRWEVVDDGNGEVLGRYATRNEALEMSKLKGQSSKEIYWHGEDGLWHLRHPDPH